MFDPVLFAALMGSTALFSPSALFSSGEQGVWYDPSDLTTMFQDAAGTTPVTAVEQPVGLLLDKSKGLALGSELVTNGDFSGGSTGWGLTNVTVSGGVATITGAPTITQSITFVSGVTYQVSITVGGLTGGSLWLRFIGGTAANSGLFNNGVQTFFLRSNGNTTLLIEQASGTITAGTIDDISVKALLGNHASQSTAASRPVLSARVNQLLATATLATQNVTTLAATYTLAFSGTGTVTATGTNIGVYSAGSNSLVCTAGTLTLTVVGSVTLADLRVTNDGVGLPAYQAVVTSTNYDTSGFPLFLRFDGTDDSLATASIDFTATDKMSVFAGLRKLGTAANETIAETSSDYSANAGAFILNARGSNTDYLGFKGGTSGTFNDCRFETDAVPATFVFTGTIDINQALIANESDVRLNGATASQTHAGTVQTGNFGNYPLYIGRRGGTTFPFNGRLYSLIVRGALSTDAQIASTETYVNNVTKAY